MTMGCTGRCASRHIRDGCQGSTAWRPDSTRRPSPTARSCAPVQTADVHRRGYSGHIHTARTRKFRCHVIADGRVDLGIIFISPVAIAEQRFCDHGPRVGMQEDPAVLLGARRIGGNAAQFRVITIKAGRAEFDAIFGVQLFVNRIHGLDSMCR